MLLHEMTHQYHWKFNERTFPLSNAAFNKVMAAGKY
jgi:hypothetical protein